MENITDYKPINGYVGYFVTSDGKVFSTKGNETLFLKSNKNNRGYLMIGLWDNDSQKSYKKTIHRLVALHFLQDSYFEGAVVHHKDGNQLNNDVNNLEWVTQKENLNISQETMTDVNKHGRIWGGTSKGSRNGNSKLTEKDVEEIRELYESGDYTHLEIAGMYNVSKTNIGDIVRNKIWR